MNTIYTSKTKNIKKLNLNQVVIYSKHNCNNYNIDLNLRDMLRLVDVTITLKCNILDHLPLIFTDRIASQRIKNEVIYFSKHEYVITFIFLLNLFVFRSSTT